MRNKSGVRDFYSPGQAKPRQYYSPHTNHGVKFAYEDFTAHPKSYVPYIYEEVQNNNNNKMPLPNSVALAYCKMIYHVMLIFDESKEVYVELFITCKFYLTQFRVRNK